MLAAVALALAALATGGAASKGPTESEPTELLAWLRANGGVVHPSLRAYQDPQTGEIQLWTAAAPVESPQANQVLLQVPRTLSFSPQTVTGQNPVLLAASRADANPRLPPLLVVGIGLMIERALGSESFWAPWLDTLPDPPLSAVFYHSDVLELLDNCAAVSSIGRRRAGFRRLYESAFLPIFQRERESFPGPDYFYSLDAFMKAMALVAGQGFPMDFTGVESEPVHVLIPLFHALSPKYVGKRASQQMELHNEFFRVVFLKDYEPNKQVFMTRKNPLSNVNLLVDRGVAYRDKDYFSTELEMSGSCAERTEASCERLKAIMNERSVPWMGIFAIDYNSGIAAPFMRYLRYAHMDDANMDAQAYKFADDGEMISLDNEYRALSTLMVRLEDKLSRFKTLAEEDEMVLTNPKKKLSRSKRAVITECYGEKLTIEKTIETLVDELADLREALLHHYHKEGLDRRRP